MKILLKPLGDIAEKVMGKLAARVAGIFSCPMEIAEGFGDLAYAYDPQRGQYLSSQLVATLSMAEFPVLQEGGEIKPDLGNELTSQQWEKVAKEFFK